MNDIAEELREEEIIEQYPEDIPPANDGVYIDLDSVFDLDQRRN